MVEGNRSRSQLGNNGSWEQGGSWFRPEVREHSLTKELEDIASLFPQGMSNRHHPFGVTLSSFAL